MADRRPQAKLKCLVATAVWGDRYIDNFAAITLPNLLSAGNLPALAGILDSEYLICSPPAGIERLRKQAAFRRLESVMPITVLPLDTNQLTTGTAAQSTVFRQIIDIARNGNAALCYCMPDAVWADGSFRKVAESFAKGRPVILQPSIRVVEETILPLLRRRRNSEGILSLSEDDMMELGLAHLHPLVACYHRHSKRYPRHAEFVLTDIGREIGLTRYFEGPSIFMPDRVRLGPKLLIDSNVDERTSDPTGIFTLSLTPLTQDASWYREPCHFSYETAARSWLDFDSPVNDSAARDIFPLGKATRAPIGHDFRRAQQTVRLRALNLAGARAINALIRTLPAHSCKLAAQFLAGALHWAHAQRMALGRDNVIVIVPSDQALRHHEAAVFGLFAQNRAPALRALIRGHVALASGTRIGSHTSLAGTSVALKGQGSALVVNGMPAKDIGEVFRGLRVVIVDGLLFDPESVWSNGPVPTKDEQRTNA